MCSLHVRVYRQNTTLLKCQYEVWKSGCGEDFARVLATYNYKFLKRQLAAYNCDFGKLLSGIFVGFDTSANVSAS